MTPSEREAIYDTEIAPELERLSRRCTEVGMSMVAEVEWDGKNAAGGLTVGLSEGSSFAIRLVKLASEVRGNVDGLILGLRKSKIDLSASVYMRILDRNEEVRR